MKYIFRNYKTGYWDKGYITYHGVDDYGEEYVIVRSKDGAEYILSPYDLVMI